MTAGKYDITIEQGATYDVTLTWRDSSNALVNLTGYSARLMARESVDSTTTLISITDGAGITLGGAAGTIRILLSAATTAALGLSGVYDLEMVSGAGVVTRLVEGFVILNKEVTR